MTVFSRTAITRLTPHIRAFKAALSVIKRAYPSWWLRLLSLQKTMPLLFILIQKANKRSM